MQPGESIQDILGNGGEVVARKDSKLAAAALKGLKGTFKIIEAMSPAVEVVSLKSSFAPSATKEAILEPSSPKSTKPKAPGM